MERSNWRGVPPAHQAAEVALRNRTDTGLRARYGNDWWSNPDLTATNDRERKEDIATALRRIKHRKAALATPQVIATLSFGFWVGMLQPRYNPMLWSGTLRTAFPKLPADKNRYDLAAAAKRVCDLRNRIWHHEPIFRMNLSEEHRATLDLLAWACPEKAAWIKPHCRVPHLLRQKP